MVSISPGVAGTSIATTARQERVKISFIPSNIIQQLSDFKYSGKATPDVRIPLYKRPL